MGEYGIGIPEWRILVTLGQFGVMTGKAIGTHTHMHKTKVSRAVAQLEQRKLLLRRANRDDLREAFLSLTPAGRAIYEELAPRALEFTDRLSEVVAPADRAAFDRAVKQLTERSAKLINEAGDRRNLMPLAFLNLCRIDSMRIAREALFLFPLVRRLSRAHRVQPQGFEL